MTMTLPLAICQWKPSQIPEIKWYFSFHFIIKEIPMAQIKQAARIELAYVKFVPLELVISDNREDTLDRGAQRP